MKKLFVLAIVIAASVSTVFAQSVKETQINPDEDIYNVVDAMPEFPGGVEAMNKWLSQNIQYPQNTQKQKIEGRVICQFVVSSTGKIKDVTVVKSVEKSLDNEAVRAISAMPDWKPGVQDGKAVNVRYILPIKFKL